MQRDITKKSGNKNLQTQIRMLTANVFQSFSLDLSPVAVFRVHRPVSNTGIVFIAEMRMAVLVKCVVVRLDLVEPDAFSGMRVVNDRGEDPVNQQGVIILPVPLAAGTCQINFCFLLVARDVFGPSITSY